MEAQRKLVVIGNGMAGARTVEEILARGGGDQFDITMFGEEPTGNYNRILLSNVLNGSYKEDEIFLNPLDWYRENNIRLLAGTRAAGILRRARLVFAEDGTPQPYDKLIIATGSRPFLLFKTPSLTYPQALLILGVIIACCSVLVFAVRFSEKDEMAARQEIEARLSGRLTPVSASAMGD